MSDLFFYGTLRYIPLLELVMGRFAAEMSVCEAMLPDHAVYGVRGQAFPMIVNELGGETHGILLRGVTPEDQDRLTFYEGGFDYDLHTKPVTVSDGSIAEAQVFFPAPGSWTPDDLWSLERWVAEWGPVTVLAAEEVMSCYGRVNAKLIEQSFPAIRTRAWAKLAARKRHTGDCRDTADVIVHDHRRAYVNYFGMEEVDLQHRRYDGSMSPVLKRSGLMQGAAVVVLPYDPRRDCVLLVEQFRPPVFLSGDPEPWIWEPVAGMIDPGETPEQAAHREVFEEAGIKLASLEAAGGAYSSSGSSTEYIHLYAGIGDLTETTHTGGVATEGEDIRSRIVSFENFMEQVDGNTFKDLPLLSLAHWLARHRDRLRDGYPGL